MNAAKNAAKNVAKSALDDPNKRRAIFTLVAIFVIVVIILAIYYGMKTKDEVATPANVKRIETERTVYFETNFTKQFIDRKSLLQAIQEQQVDEKENCLINFQPLTVIYPGYLGPKKDGVFSDKEGVNTVLRMGARCLVLPIDYHDTDTMAETFPEAFKPCLLYRDAAGVNRSLNAGDIQKIAQNIADLAWSDQVNQKDDPFILVLYFLKTPAQNTREYLDFLSQVAVNLEPLYPYLLGQTPEGIYNRQGRQNELMFVSTSTLEKKLIVLCNVDTSGFRTSSQDFNHSYLPKEDLDYWTHMTVYKENPDTSLGATETPGQLNTPRAMVQTKEYYTTLPTDPTSQKNAITATKEKFTIALSPHGLNPEVKELEKLQDTFGVQSVPFLLIDYNPLNQTLLSKYKYAWKAKPKSLRYVRPEAIRIQTQSTTVNANGGGVTMPS